MSWQVTAARGRVKVTLALFISQWHQNTNLDICARHNRVKIFLFLFFFLNKMLDSKGQFQWEPSLKGFIKQQ